MSKNLEKFIGKELIYKYDKLCKESMIEFSRYGVDGGMEGIRRSRIFIVDEIKVDAFDGGMRIWYHYKDTKFQNNYVFGAKFFDFCKVVREKGDLEIE